jgi:hypothetical protein
MPDDDIRPALAFFEKLLDAQRKLGGGKSEIQYDVFANAVRDDPESAAEIVLGVCRKADIPQSFAQMAIGIAEVYHRELGDDSLLNEVRSAPWVNRVSAPAFLDTRESANPPSHPLLSENANAVRILEVAKDDLQSGSVNRFVALFAIEGKSSEIAAKLPTLWGMCILVFPYENDPRNVWEIPEVRRLVAQLQKNIPYFPGYLHFGPEFGMFLVYFGSLADPEAFSGNSIDLMHPSVLGRVGESLRAFGSMAARIGKDPRPVWRTILSPYPQSISNKTVEKFYKELFG